MQHIVRKNIVFLAAFLLWLLACVVALFYFEKGDVLLGINATHSSLADVFFKYATFLGDGLFAGILVFVLLFYRFRLSFLVLMSTLISSLIIGLLKQSLNYPRPVLYFEGLDLQLVEGVRMYNHLSFPSGHTGAAFSVFCALALWSSRKHFFALFMLFLAITVAISRVYLAQHFLMDVAAGSAIAVVTTFFIFFLMEKHPLFRSNGRLDQSLLTMRKSRLS